MTKEGWSWYNYIGLSPPPRRQKIDISNPTDKPIILNFWESWFGIFTTCLLVFLCIALVVTFCVLLTSGIIQIIKWLPW